MIAMAVLISKLSLKPASPKCILCNVVHHVLPHADLPVSPFPDEIGQCGVAVRSSPSKFHGVYQSAFFKAPPVLKSLKDFETFSERGRESERDTERQRASES